MTTTGEPAAKREVVGRRLAPGEKTTDDFTYSVVELPGAKPSRWGGAERRADRRLRTRLRDAILGERKHRVLAECRIKDRSQQGVRLQLDSARALPRSFVLTDGASRCCYRATLVWQIGQEAGVRLSALD